MSGKTELNDLKLLVQSRTPIIVIETHEETRALALVRELAIGLGKPFFSWNLVDGLRRQDKAHSIGPLQHTEDPLHCLKHIREMTRSAIFALCDFHPWLDDEPKAVRLLKDLALDYANREQTLVLISHSVTIPPELARLVARFELALPGAEQLEDLIREVAREWSADHAGLKVNTDPETLKMLISNLAGLTFADARQLVRNLVYDGAITRSELPEVNRAKYRLLDLDGAVHYEYETAQFSEVGGLEKLKAWLEQRGPVFRGEYQALTDRPRGMMLIGVQGGGKSLAAKAVAGLWQLPLLRLDFGALYNKYHGETEKNLRKALNMASLMAPCVLWLDEVEKGIATGDSDGGVSRRVLGSLLTWMQENQAPVFVVATANDIQRLPPELMRKGRLDEIFFVDLPDVEVREDIFRIHLAKRQQQPGNFNLALLAQASEGYSGAEIEQAVVSALYGALSASEALQDTHILDTIKATSPLSVVMAEQVSALRHWSEGRTVMAH